MNDIKVDIDTAMDKSVHNTVSEPDLDSKHDKVERDVIDWRRISAVGLFTSVGIILYFSGFNLYAYFFLGVSALSIVLMITLKTWRTSTEIDRAARQIESNTLSGFLALVVRSVFGVLAAVFVAAAGGVPLFLVSDALLAQYNGLFLFYMGFVAIASVAVLFWVAGYFKMFRQVFATRKALAEAHRKTNARRAREKLELGDAP